MSVSEASLTLMLAHIAKAEPSIADRARKASAAAAVVAGVAQKGVTEWREDFEQGYVNAERSTRASLRELLAHPLAAMFPTLALELFLAGMSADDVLAELRKAV